MSNLTGSAAALGLPANTLRDVVDTVEHNLLIAQSLSAAVVMLTEVKSDAEARIQAAYAVASNLEELLQTAISTLNGIRQAPAFRSIAGRTL